MRPFKFTVDPEKEIHIPLSGEIIYVYDVSSRNPLFVRIDSLNIRAFAVRSSKVRAAKRFDGFIIENPSSVTITGILLVGGSDYDLELPGFVETVDQARANVIDGLVFTGLGSLSATVAQYPHFLLRNKSTDHRIIIKSLRLADYTGTTNWVLSERIGALAAVNSAPRARVFGGTVDAVGEVSQGTYGSFVSGTDHDQFPQNGIGDKLVTFDDPVILEPTYGLMVTNLTVNHEAGVTFIYEVEVL